MIHKLSLTHFSSRNPINLDGGRCYSQSNGSLKPRGLWVSVDGEYNWEEWCREEEFLDLTEYRSRSFTLVRDHNVLIVSTEQGIDDLDKMLFGSEGSIGKLIVTAPRWDHIAEQYQGVIITPYQGRHIFGPLWYYGWDCASGCIWDLRSLNEFADEQVDVGAID